MKKLLVILLTGLSLTSCTKKVTSPNGAANQNIFYQDANVAVENLKAVPTATGTVNVSFSTAFANNISRIELMSSTTNSTFCTTQTVEVESNSAVPQNYSLTDAHIKSSTMYYLLRFKDIKGNWSYTSDFTVQVK